MLEKIYCTKRENAFIPKIHENKKLKQQIRLLEVHTKKGILTQNGMRSRSPSIINKTDEDVEMSLTCK
jgi:hypothetical protein